MNFQSKTHSARLKILILIFVGLSFFETYTHIFPEIKLLLGIYLTIIVAVTYLLFRTKKSDFENKYLDYRALAEALRVQFFWRLAGITDSVSDHYLRKIRSELDWVSVALRSSNLASRYQSKEEDCVGKLGAEKRWNWVYEKWVKDQRNFFQRSAPKNHSREQLFQRSATAAYIVAIALAIIQLVILHHPDHFIFVSIVLTLIVAALLREYAEARTYGIQARRYQWMGSLYANAEKRLRILMDAENWPKARELIKELGKEALEENGDWVIYHRERPLKAPPDQPVILPKN